MSHERWLRNKEIRDKRRREQKERENAPRITLNVVDELTGRTGVFDVPNYYTFADLTDYLANRGFLAKSQYSRLRYFIREQQEYKPYVRIQDTCLRNGDTLHAVFADADLLRKSGAEEFFFEEYDVIVQWKEIESSIFIREISEQYHTEHFTCCGYETKSGIEEMLRRVHISGRVYLEFRIKETNWPEYRVGIGGASETVKYLCQLSKKRKVLLFAEAELLEQDLYGCPSAKIFRDSDALQNCRVEIIDYI